MATITEAVTAATAAETEPNFSQPPPSSIPPSEAIDANTTSQPASDMIQDQCLPSTSPSSEDVEAVTNASSTAAVATAPTLPEPDKLEDQSSRLPMGQLIIVCISLIMAIFLTSLEQTSVSTAVPTISMALGSYNERAWIGTAFLIGNTASQSVYGRLSDIFGRKPMHLLSLGIFFIGSLLCGFARSMSQLIAFRGITGFGGGGVIVCVMTIMSDLVSLKNRGKIQAVVGIGTILANAIGPTLGGAFAESNWRWIFWVVCPPAAIAFIQCVIWLPLRPVQGDIREKLCQIDYLGIFTQLIAIIFLLIPISGGGSSFPWSSAISIAFIVIGGVFFCLFLIIEGTVAKHPIVPLYIFKESSLALLSLATFCTGAYFFSAVYYLPIFFQNIKGIRPITSSGYIQALILPQVVTIFFSGFFLSWHGKYNYMLWAGYSIYLIGAGLATRFDPSSDTGYIIGILVTEGLGMGLTLQTSLVAMQAIGEHKDRAVITGVRNMMRFIGGSFGLAICSALTHNETLLMEGLEKVWWFLFAIGATVFLAGFGVKDVGINRKDVSPEIKENHPQTSTEESGESDKIVGSKEVGS